MGALKSSFKRFCGSILSNKRHFLGIVLILLVVLLWVGSSNLIQHIFTGGGFGKPFFTTYFSTSMFTLYLSGFLFIKRWRQIPWNAEELLNQNNIVKDARVNSLTFNETDDKETILLDSETSLPPFEDIKEKESVLLEDVTPEPPKTLKQVLFIALQFCALWLIANFTYNYSISRTSVSSSTIISTTSSFWTLAFCHILKIERFSLKNLLAVAIT